LRRGRALPLLAEKPRGSDALGYRSMNEYEIAFDRPCAVA